MKYAWTHIAPLLTLALFLSGTVDGRQKPPSAVADALRSTLEKKGYVAIPLTQEAGERGLTVECKSGSETFRMLLDTGREDSSLDMDLVKKLGLKHEDKVKTIGIGGIQEGVKGFLRGVTIGGFDTRTTLNTLSVSAFDFTAVNTGRDQRKLRRIDGLLGHAALRLNAAVIDYPARTLYLRTPLAGLWPEVEGKWTASGGQEDGQERRVDPKAPPRLEFKDGRFHLTDGPNSYTFGLHVRPGKDRYTLDFFDPEQEFVTELKYRSGGLLKMSGDKLTVRLCIDQSKAKKGDQFPDDFTAPAGSGRLLLEFHRDKPLPAGRPIAAADPRRAVLKKKGYVAIPLIQQEEENGCFMVECKSGNETFRLLLDTGAEVSALDTGLAKKLGFKPQGEIAGVGAGGTLEGVEVSLRGLSIGEFDSRATFKSLDMTAFDFTAVNAALAQHRKLRPIDGVLGHSHLEVYSAVIDYPNRTLYLRSPLNGLWPEIEGKWVAITGQEEGRDVPLDPKTPIRVEFKDRQFRLSVGTDQFLCGMHVKPGKDRYTMVFFHPEQELAKELEYRAGGLLKVSGDKLTLCLALDPEAAMGLPATAKGLPDDFKAPAGSGHLLLEFRREK